MFEKYLIQQIIQKTEVKKSHICEIRPRTRKYQKLSRVHYLRDCHPCIIYLYTLICLVQESCHRSSHIRPVPSTLNSCHQLVLKFLISDFHQLNVI